MTSTNVVSRLESLVKFNWPSFSFPSALLSASSLLLSSIQKATRAYPPRRSSDDVIRTVSYYSPSHSETSKEKPTRAPDQGIIDHQPASSHLAVYDQHFDRSNSLRGIASDVESLPESVDEPDDAKGPPFAIISFHEGPQRFLLGLFSFLLSESSIASIINLDQIKKSLSEDGDQEQAYKTLTNHLQVLLSRLRFGLICCAQLLVNPLLQVPQAPFDVFPLQSVERLWPTGPLCSVALTSAYQTSHEPSSIPSESEPSEEERNTPTVKPAFILEYLDHFFIFCRGVLAVELVSMRPLQLPRSCSSASYLPQPVTGIDSLFLTDDLDDLPSWITARFHETAVLKEILPRSQSVLNILPGLSTTSLPHSILSSGLSIEGIPITMRWTDKIRDLVALMSDAIRNSQMFQKKQIKTQSGLSVATTNLECDFLKGLPKVVFDTFIDGDVFVQRKTAAVHFGGWELSWYLEIYLCEVLGVAATRLFGLPVS